MKKLLLIIFLLTFTFSFAQQNENARAVVNQKAQPVTLFEIAAYPNPFNIKTKISFKSSKTQTVEFTVKNLLGKTVYLEKFEAKNGLNSIEFDRGDLSKGMYIYSLQTDTEIASKRLVIR